jgi:hypothetical protein
VLSIALLNAEIVAAVIGGLFLVAGAGVGALWRVRTAARTAARVIYAELAANSAPVGYFRARRAWPHSELKRTAWNAHGQALARLRDARVFHEVQSGYLALEAIEFSAQAAHGEGGLLDAARLDAALDRWVESLTTALRRAGRIARLHGATVEGDLASLRPAGHDLGPAASGGPAAIAQTGVVPPLALLEAMRAGSEIARQTLRGALRTVFDAGEGSDASRSRVVRREGDPPVDDPVVNAVYDAAGATDALFREWGRDGLDGKGGPIELVVHYRQRYPNVVWNGKQLLVGDGDPELLTGFAFATDVIGHELSHAVIWSAAALVFHREEGALFESIADVFGELVEQRSLGQTVDEADWLMGKVLGKGVNGRALRSLAAPGTAYQDDVLGADRQPATMTDFVETEEDHGGVHINSGIPNHAFYLVATALGGHAWELAGRIWYEALCRIHSPAGFSDFAEMTRGVAAELYGADSEAMHAVRKAWAAVGVAAPPHS